MSPSSPPTFVSRFEPHHVEDPYPLYARLRQEAPVHFSEEMHLWVVSRHEDVKAVVLNPEDFLSANAFKNPVPPAPEVLAALAEGYPQVPALVDDDPPNHTRMRVIVTKALAPHRLSAMEPRIHAIATELLDGFARDGRADLVEKLGYPLPARVIGAILGLPDSDLERLKRWTEDLSLLSAGNAPVARQVECARGLVSIQKYLAGHIAERRLAPRDDLISALIEARHEDTPPLSDVELISLLAMLHFAGHETTANLLGNLLAWVLKEPERLRELSEEPSRIPRAIEETLRLDAPVQAMMRTTRRAVKVGDVEVPQGARVLVLYASANRDGAAFHAPERGDPLRSDLGKHLGFGLGIHYCIGAPLARMEVRVAMEQLLKRLPGLRLAPGNAITYVPNFLHRGPRQLRVEWDPA
ncbi:cytochrome P450 [Myxococcus llanfairpwllgwyngyllgogerychwyrndrobwllllantysiliogogogochensis]|uniref:Cytochrome P450 n=1 Tax=Myxococcus llanfairpwllgwyngyllgogerychwyrndrobwllllantysiliogogogochensis TaxID=2590453 RepID=A0A540WW26_9BACT|nr:cytochrome P450 [Myxococcus llanfairpwllgwyngyllgogerychwyrndrobwllllantysiliogogogochensis]TQF13205.1 cytochrome P450 [Myxococcus llanfairpwllgwyngyllgogerychwyrndrobwllllantysiliogogogochensis]